MLGRLRLVGDRVESKQAHRLSPSEAEHGALDLMNNWSAELTVNVSFTVMTEVERLAGRGYNTLGRQVALWQSLCQLQVRIGVQSGDQQRARRDVPPHPDPC